MQNLGGIRLRIPTMVMLLATSICLQMWEGYAWYQVGDSNCGTQMKIISLITTTLICLVWREMIVRNQDSKQKDKKWHQLLIIIGIIVLK